jgi:hypothetical protein
MRNKPRAVVRVRDETLNMNDLLIKVSFGWVE